MIKLKAYPCIYKNNSIIKTITIANKLITIIGNYYMSFFGYSYFTINTIYYKQIVSKLLVR